MSTVAMKPDLSPVQWEALLVSRARELYHLLAGVGVLAAAFQVGRLQAQVNAPHEAETVPMHA